MSTERSTERAVLDFLTDPEEGPDHLAQETEQSQELYQQAEQQFETIVLSRLFVLMHIELGSAAYPPHRQVTTYMATCAPEILIGTECTFIQQGAGSSIVFAVPVEHPKPWDKKIKQQYLRGWLKLPWTALTDPLDSSDPMSSVRVVVSERRGSRRVDTGLKAIFDLLVVYGAFITHISSTNFTDFEYHLFQTFLHRLEGLRNGALNQWAHRLAEAHKMHM